MPVLANPLGGIAAAQILAVHMAVLTFNFFFMPVSPGLRRSRSTPSVAEDIAFQFAPN